MIGSMCSANETLFGCLNSRAVAHPTAVAILEPGRPAASFSELLAAIRSARESFQRAGIAPRERVAVWIESSSDMAVAVMALSTGAACAPLAPLLTRDEAGESFTALSATTLVTDAAAHGVLCRTARDLGLRIVRVRVRRDRPSGSFEVIDSTSARARRWRRAGPKNVALLLQTTGSTARPKVAPITHRAITLTCFGAARSLRLEPSDRCLNFMALHHVHGLVSGVFLPLLAGGSSALVGTFDVDGFYDWLQVFSPTWFSTSPAIYQIVLRDMNERKLAPEADSLRFVRVGSASLSLRLAEQIEAAFRVPLIEAYGMTETLQISGNPVGDRRLGSVGRSIAPEIEVFDERRRRCAPFATGSIAVRGPTIITRYADGSRDRESFKRGWFLTGDLGWLDDEGFLYLEGRQRDLIIRGGENIAPAEVEQALLDHPDVAETCVFGVPHAILGEDVAAVVVLKRGARVREADLRGFVRTHLSPHKTPCRIFTVNELPRTPTGKVVRQRLSETYGHQIVSTRGAGGPPRSATERMVARWFTKILEVAEPGREDDFFSLGGTSMDVAALVAGIGSELGEIVHGISFLKEPTIAAFAALLSRDYSSAVSRVLGDASRDRRSLSRRTRRVLGEREVAEFRTTLPRIDKLAIDGEARTSVEPLFILCSPRSGSTLLRTMMAGHESLFAPPELRLLQCSTLRDWKKSLSGEYSFFQEGLLRAVMTAVGCDVREANEWVRLRVHRNLTIGDVYEELDRAAGPRRIVDKSPLYALDPAVLERMESLFRAPSYVHLVRSPRAMIRSFERAHLEQIWMHERRFSPAELAELVWSGCHENILEFLGTVPGERQIRIHFEDLVRSPERVVRRVCRFLGVDFSPSMLEPQADPERRMSEGVVPGARMIGDPRFFEHRGIDATRAESCRELPGDVPLADRTLRLSAALGCIARPVMKTAASADDGLDPDLVEHQHRLLSSWRGVRHRPGSFIVGRNTTGRREPLFWCLQASVELEQLSVAVGREQPLYAMRSANMLSKEAEVVAALGRTYARELQEIKPEGPFLLGGNCQGGRVMWEVARELLRRGREVTILCLVDVHLRKAFPGRVALFYGRESEKDNPFRTMEDPEKEWRELYGAYTVEEISGGHGEFFEEPNLGDLTSRLRRRIDEAVRLRRDRGLLGATSGARRGR